METLAAQVVTALAPLTNLKSLTWGRSNAALPFVLVMFLVRGLVQIVTNRPDVIHSQDAVTAPLTWLLSKISNRPYTVMVHGLDLTYNKFMYQRLIPPFVRKADSVIANSHATAEIAMKLGIDADKIAVIPLAVISTADGAPTQTRQTNQLLTIGRLVKRKGVQWFIKQVLPELVKEFPDLKYHVVGTGPRAEQIAATVDRLNLQDNVILHGRISEAEKADLLASVPIFVMPNIPIQDDIEGFGLVAQEAALAEMTVLASNLEGIKTAVVDQKNGYLLEAENPEAYIKLITSLLRDPNPDFGRQAAVYTKKHFSIEAMGQQFSTVFGEAIESRASNV